MVKATWILAAVFICGGAARAIAEGSDSETGKRPRPEQVAALRERGPDGLKEALRIYDGVQLEQAQQSYSCRGQIEPSTEAAGGLAAWSAAIDQIGAQRGCTVSRLYWYTDLAAAKAEAEKTGRPILSLRLLGKLTDEFSCANSRFFRTALYSNKEISDYLRDNFVLHWQSVRPVPRVTIDFGDGRKLERTLTGNSAHYVLANDGTALDVLPGLYGPQKFLQWLQTTRNLDSSYHIAQSRPAPGPRWAQLLKQYHLHHRDAILQTWDQDLQRLGEKQEKLVSTRITGAIEAAGLTGQPLPNALAPTAKAAASRAVTKSDVELPMLRFANFGSQWMEKGMDDELWRAVAALHREGVHLDENSIVQMRKEFPRAADAAQQAATKQQVEDPVLRMVRSFEESMSLDEVHNEYLLHRRVHERLAESEAGTMDFDTLNEWVYAELFLTPSKDPWLGLAPSDVYSALDGDGRVQPAQAASPHGG
jgi:hypothetical protein